jgi:mycothiol system anti-sigma-R factor
MIGWLLDNELDREQTVQIETHLEACVDCQQALEEDGQLRRVLRRAAASVDTPVSLRHRVRQSMQREPQSQVGLAQAWPAAVAAAILVSFVWHGQAGWVPPAARTGWVGPGQKGADISAREVEPVEAYLRRHLAEAVRLPRLGEADSALAPVQVAAELVEQGDQRLARVHYMLPKGEVVLTIASSAAEDAKAAPQTNAPQVADVGLVPTGLWPADTAPAVAGSQQEQAWLRWQAKGLQYAVTADLDPQMRAAVLAQLQP